MTSSSLASSGSITIWRFAENHRALIAAGLIVASALVFLARPIKMKPTGDVGLYDRIATDAVEGKLPYRDRPLEYPPYVIPLFLVPRLWGREGFLTAFPCLTFLADLSIKLILFAVGLRATKSLRSLIPLAFYCLAVPFLAHLYLSRYDVWPSLVCLIGLIFFWRGHYTLAGVAIAVGIGLKAYPALFVPPLLILAWHHRKAREFSFGIVLGLLPLFAAGFFMPWWRFAAFHAARGLQVESTYAAILWCGKLLGIWSATWFKASAWNEVHGPAATMSLPWAHMLWAGSTIFSVGVATWVTWKQRDFSLGRFAKVLLIPLIAFVAFNQVFSPQYMIWFLPLAALACLEAGEHWPWPSLAILAATMVTPLTFPSFFHDYGTGLNLFEATVLLLRNLVLILVWGRLVIEMLATASQPREFVIQRNYSHPLGVGMGLTRWER